MPLDALFLSGLTKELQMRVTGAKIDKVQQPERDMILVSLRGKGENLRILLAAGTGNARVHLTETAFENPTEPPMFCMLLRKHLVGARIAELYQPDYERILVFELDTRDELGVESRKKLIAELIGRSANLILVDSQGRIIDCLRRMDYGGDALRRMQPGMIYRFPPKQAKPALLDTNEEQRAALIDNADKSAPIETWLLKTFSGLSPLICRELAWRCGGDYDALPSMLTAFVESVNSDELKPFLYSDGKIPREYSFMPLKQYGDQLCGKEMEGFSNLLDVFYSSRDRMDQQRRRAHDLTRSVKTMRDRQQRKLAGQKEELRRTDDRDNVRKMAELITANIYRIHKGDRTLSCVDYYSEDGREIEIPLDPMKSPQQNAAMLFKEYNKLKSARTHLSTLITEGESRLDYLNSVLSLIESAESEKDLSDIRRELIETGFLRSQPSKKKEKGKPQAPLRFLSSDGHEILVGRSNIQNDELTTKLARRSDYWLHTQKIHGSHVILRTEDAEPSEQCIEEAAIIAAYYSQGREGGKIPIDYTPIRYVRKPSGALPGKVIYTEYKTLMVCADETLVRKLIVK